VYAWRPKSGAKKYRVIVFALSLLYFRFVRARE